LPFEYYYDANENDILYEFLFDQTCRFDLKTKTFTLLEKETLGTLPKNLFLFEEELLEDLKIALKKDYILSCSSVSSGISLSNTIIHKSFLLFLTKLHSQFGQITNFLDFIVKSNLLFLLQYKELSKNSVSLELLNQIKTVLDIANMNGESELRATINDFFQLSCKAVKSTKVSSKLEKSTLIMKRIRRFCLESDSVKKTKKGRPVAEPESNDKTSICLKCSQSFEDKLEYFPVKTHRYSLEKLLGGSSKKAEVQIEGCSKTSPVMVHTTCNHSYHFDCIKSEMFCLYCKREMDGIFCSFKNETINKQGSLNLSKNHLYKNFTNCQLSNIPKYIEEKIKNPIYNSFLICHLVNEDRFCKNIFPCIRQLLIFISKISQFSLFKQQIFKQSVTKLNKLCSLFDLKKNSTLSDHFADICIEKILIHLIIEKAIKVAEFYEDYSLEQIEKENRLHILELIKEFLPKMIIFKLAQKGLISKVNQWSEVLVFANCFDLINLAFTMLYCFSKGLNQEVSLSENISSSEMLNGITLNLSPHKRN
jgi:hypothetical protein